MKRQENTLTPRQREVLALLGKGLSNAAIARELGIATGTAKLHVAGVLASLRVRNRTRAAVLAPQLLAQAQPEGLTAAEVAWCHAHAEAVRALIARHPAARPASAEVA